MPGASNRGADRARRLLDRWNRGMPHTGMREMAREARVETEPGRTVTLSLQGTILRAEREPGGAIRLNPETGYAFHIPIKGRREWGGSFQVGQAVRREVARRVVNELSPQMDEPQPPRGAREQLDGTTAWEVRQALQGHLAEIQKEFCQGFKSLMDPDTLAAIQEHLQPGNQNIWEEPRHPTLWHYNAATVLAPEGPDSLLAWALRTRENGPEVRGREGLEDLVRRDMERQGMGPELRTFALGMDLPMVMEATMAQDWEQALEKVREMQWR